MTGPDDTSDFWRTSPEPARTPPPRVRRGAPTPEGDPGRAPAPELTRMVEPGRTRPPGALTEPTPAPRPVEAQAPRGPRPAQAPAARPGKPPVRPERRFRQTIQKVDLWSVTKMALCFYASAMGVLVVSGMALWVVADSAGIIDSVENFIGDLLSADNFQFVSGQALRGAALIGVVFVAISVALSIIGASLYNIFAELFGGIEMVIREEEEAPPKR
ncbi:MAG: hypothetical protein FJW77_03840 [Actinobacteria bacterium]|nr:hypothetical protein [Actinomycetota bacterium]